VSFFCCELKLFTLILPHSKGVWLSCELWEGVYLFGALAKMAMTPPPPLPPPPLFFGRLNRGAEKKLDHIWFVTNRMIHRSQS
jgi:hypothetical protein